METKKHNQKGEHTMSQMVDFERGRQLVNRYLERSFALVCDGVKGEKNQKTLEQLGRAVTALACLTKKQAFDVMPSLELGKPQSELPWGSDAFRMGIRLGASEWQEKAHETIDAQIQQHRQAGIEHEKQQQSVDMSW